MDVTTAITKPLGWGPWLPRTLTMLTMLTLVAAGLAGQRGVALEGFHAQCALHVSMKARYPDARNRMEPTMLGAQIRRSC